MLGYLLIGFVALGVLSIMTFPPIRQVINYRGNKTYYYRHESDFVSEYSDGNPLCKGERASASDLFTCYAKDITSAQEKIGEYYKNHLPLNPKPIVVKCKTEIMFGFTELACLAASVLVLISMNIGETPRAVLANEIILALMCVTYVSDVIINKIFKMDKVFG